MWVERTAYFAKPGLGAEVLETRRLASAVRAAIGLPVGSIFVSAGGEGPDVRWECSFPSAEAHAADLAARGASVEFESVRVHMRTLLARFERAVERIDETSPLANGMVTRSLHGAPLVPREIAFRSGNHALKAYFYTPPGAGPFPCMVLNHGSGIDKGTLDVSRPGTASLLAGWGIASFLPHRHGYGNSEGPGWRDEVSASFGTPEYDAQLAARLDRESEDVLAACEIAAALPEVRAEHLGVMGSSFGGVNTLLSASKSKRFRCAVEFAGAAMNWDRTPGLRKLMTDAALRLTMPIFFIQSENDYSIRPTRELAEALEKSSVTFQAKVFPAFGFNPNEGHLFERDGAHLWGAEVRQFLERYFVKGAWLEDLTWPQAAARIASAVVVIPIGARAKEHGHHLPLKTDYLVARALGDRLISALPVLVAPVIDFGYYPAFLRYPGSQHLRAETFIAVLQDILNGFLDQGATRLAIVNTGVSTVPPIRIVVRDLYTRRGVRVPVADIERLGLAVRRRLSRQKLGGHADQFETSTVLAIEPAAVDMSRAEPDYGNALTEPQTVFYVPTEFRGDPGAGPDYSKTGVRGDPTLANAVEGEELLAEMAREISEGLTALFEIA